MRLWHYKSIPYLPRQQLLGQHTEICALRGLGWGRKHSTVDYVFRHSWNHLLNFHTIVMHEMKKRGYNVNPLWTDYYYRGKRCPAQNPKWLVSIDNKHYPEHNQEYLNSCIVNLTNKIKDAKPGKYNEKEIIIFYTWAKTVKK